MWSVAVWPLLGPVSRYPVTCAGLCGLVEGWVPVDASSGCPIIDWAVETRRWGAGWWPWWCLGGDMPHYIEIAIVLMNWLITLYCFYLLFFFTNNCCFSIKVCHVLLCMSRNTGQINPAGFQSLKYMYYTHVIMTIKWFLTLTLTLTKYLLNIYTYDMKIIEWSLFLYVIFTSILMFWFSHNSGIPSLYWNLSYFIMTLSSVILYLAQRSVVNNLI